MFYSLFFYYQWYLHDKLIKLTHLYVDYSWLAKLFQVLGSFCRGFIYALLLLLPLCLQTPLSVNPGLPAADLNSSRHPSYTAKTLRDSQSFPNSDSLWKEAMQRQPSGFPVPLLSRIKQSNRRHETCSTGTSSAYCSLFGKELNRL